MFSKTIQIEFLLQLKFSFLVRSLRRFSFGIFPIYIWIFFPLPDSNFSRIFIYPSASSCIPHLYPHSQSRNTIVYTINLSPIQWENILKIPIPNQKNTEL